jgi:CRP/FNR family transcriptional regulator
MSSEVRGVSMMDKLAVLRRSLLFSALDATFLPKIAGRAFSKAFGRGETVFQEGEEARGFYIVGRGRVKIFKLSPGGGEHILHLIGEGGVFAEAVVFGRLTRYPAFAQALTDAQLLFFPKQDFLQLMKADFGLTLAVLNSVSEKLRYFNALVEELSLKSADARLAKYLLDLSLRAPEAVFALGVKKVELAARLGIAPETLSRLLRRFKTRKLISLQKDRIRLLAKDRLQRICGGEKV